MNKIVVPILLIVLLCGIVGYYFAVQGEIEVENSSGRKIDLFTVKLGDTTALEKAFFKDGEIEVVKFNPNQVESIEVKTQLASGAVSTGLVKPGLFAIIKARIQADGSIDFGDTSYETSTETEDSWGEPAPSGR